MKTLLILLLFCLGVSASPTIYLIGDSTMADKPRIEHPERGWGQLFRTLVREPAHLENHARNGRSSKSFLAEKRWAPIVSQLQAGDWVIIQFGHNDEKSDQPKLHTEPRGSYTDLLRRFVHETRAKGAHPILATPVARRRWQNGQLIPTHGDYPDAVRELARAEQVPLLDLEKRTSAMEAALGEEGSKALHLWFAPGEIDAAPRGIQDDTHYSAMGALSTAKLAVDEIRRLRLDLAHYLTYGDATVAADGSGDFTSIQQAIMAAPYRAATEPWIIRILPGTYAERVYVQQERGNLRLVGDHATTTRLTAGIHANMTGPDGQPVGTFRTATLHIDGDGFEIENLTVENSAGPVGQALALRADGDRLIFRHCRFLGWQDTILCNRGRHYFEDCEILGHCDFIFGAATAWFEQCRIHSLKDGYITAASTPANQAYGLLFHRCTITGEPDVQTYLGRPWREFAMTAFIDCTMDASIRPDGWKEWNAADPAKTVRYGESSNQGPGAATEHRVPWAHHPVDDALSPETVFNGWEPRHHSP
ncbi:pectinesterase [Haloferula luteola]|uniref:Pectinesterase n=1 Tax=Haloferula luteola TaxID=595692 RepID=A0A840V7F3_9BACT|nr:pectinesterase family protein [Haloferula luteola]MBB5353643.1 pectinesterase [Haloferula luteola]